VPEARDDAGAGDVRRVVAGRALRGFADGFVSVLLAQYLTALGFSPIEVGAIVTGTLLGSAALTLAFGLTAHRYDLRTLLLGACAVMAATGVGFAGLTWFWPLLIVAVVGTLNPSAGDVSVFLPAEQALVAARTDGRDLPRTYALYNVAGVWAGALGALCSGIPEALARHASWKVTTAQRTGFLFYAATAVAILVVYRRLRRTPRPPHTDLRRGVLRTSRRTVLELAALFSLDSAGGGFVVTSLLVLWLHLRFDLSAGVTGAVFFATGVVGGLSQFLAPRLAARLGLVRTMAFTHMPANVLLAATAFAPNGAVAVAMLLTRALFAQMDVPARQSFVMAVVPADERPAASSVTNVPRSLAAALTPLLAGILLAHSTFGWPLLVAGATKFTYDALLLFLYRDVPEEAGAHRGAPR
jgi:MFS family permease